MVVYAPEAPKIPIMEARMAIRRWVGVTSSTTSTTLPINVSLFALSPKILEGWAIRMTPKRAMRPARNSDLVKGVERRRKQARAVTRGTRKRKTVASARGR